MLRQFIWLVILQGKWVKVFSLAVFPTSSRKTERPRRGGGGKRNERLVVLCKGGYEEINNSHYSQEGVKGVEPVCRSWIFLAPGNPCWSNIFEPPHTLLSLIWNRLTTGKKHFAMHRSILPSPADLSRLLHTGKGRGTKKSEAQAETPQRRKIGTGLTRSRKLQYHPGKRWE